MKCLLVLALVLPFCLTIEVKFSQLYGTAIKKIEIPSCVEEPCPLVKGQPLDISITVESVYPPERVFPTVADLESNVNIDGYRNRYIYDLAPRQLFCKFQPNECPLHFNGYYIINRKLFLSVDDGSTFMSGFGSRNGKTRVGVNVVMMANDQGEGTVIGDANIILDIKKGEN